MKQNAKQDIQKILGKDEKKKKKRAQGLSPPVGPLSNTPLPLGSVRPGSPSLGMLPLPGIKPSEDTGLGSKVSICPMYILYPSLHLSLSFLCILT